MQLFYTFQMFLHGVILWGLWHSKKYIHSLTVDFLHNVSLWKKVFLSHSASRDVVITSFGHYENWLQSLVLLPCCSLIWMKLKCFTVTWFASALFSLLCLMPRQHCLHQHRVTACRQTDSCPRDNHFSWDLRLTLTSFRDPISVLFQGIVFHSVQYTL